MTLIHYSMIGIAAAAVSVTVFVFRGEPPAGTVETSEITGVKASTKQTGTSPGVTYSKAGYDITRLSPQRIDELAKKLTPEEADIILARGTERAFCGNLLDNKKDGVYLCRLCELPLFGSDAKFNSGTGWPSFFKPYAPGHVATVVDRSHGMIRDEIVCARCTAHLGHVFEDGPKPTGLRFCLNSASLTFVEKGQELPDSAKPIPTHTAYFAGGCFWGVEDRFQQLPGVIDVVSGYMGGRTENPTYRDICYKDTGHAETVKILFDPARITYRQLLERFFRFHDPTTLNRQGPDVGDQYRSAIFTADDAQAQTAASFISEQQRTDRFKSRKIVTQVKSVQEAGKFYEAEEYHQDYHLKNGGHCALPEE